MTALAPTVDTHYFGFESEHEPTCQVPVGQVCLHCTEKIEEEDCGVVLSAHQPFHVECFCRMLFSVAHLQRRCSCYGGPTGGHDDDPELSVRENARRVYREFRVQNGRPFIGPIRKERVTEGS